jgi:hypothetical protein
VVALWWHSAPDASLGTSSQAKATFRSRVGNGAKLLPLTDGRSATARRFKDLVEVVITGSASRLSGAYGALRGSYEAFQRGGFDLRPACREKQDFSVHCIYCGITGLFLAAGEVATIAILASDRKQARAIFRFISGFLKNSRLIEALIEDENTEAIKLSMRRFYVMK